MDGQVTRADAALVFYDWIPDTGNYAEGFDLSIQEKRALLRSHVNLGHPGRAEFVRILKGAGCRSDIIQYVQREFKCAGCDLEQRPPTRLPAATPRTYDFNVVIGVDVLFIHGVDNRTEHPILNITCLGTLYSTFGLIDPLRQSSKLTLKAFERLWLRTFGPPDYILYDQGTEFTGGDFQSGLEKFSILPLVTSQDAPWENGVCERRGDLCKKIYYKSREVVQPRDLDEVELLVFESAWALQTTCNRSGFTPAQRVLGRQPRLALDLVGDDRHYELSTTQDKAWKRAYEIREAARKALLEMDCEGRLQRASRARPRRALEDHVFTEGQPVTVWRQGRRGALAKVGPCYVILQNGLTVWVTRRGELWKCNASQIFPIGPLEAQGLEVIPRDLLMAKERLRFDNEKLGYIDVTQENAESSDLQRSHLDGPGTVDQGPEASAKAVVSQGAGQPDDEQEDNLPSGLDSYAPSAEPHEPQAPLEDRPRPAEPHEAQAPVAGQSEPRMSPASSSEPPPTTSTAERGQWPQAAAVKIRKRYNNNASRFRVSSSTGPMWSDVFRRQTLDLDKNEIIADETFTGDERPRKLSRALPEGVKNIETTLYYRPRPGHPDPGVAIGVELDREGDTERTSASSIVVSSGLMMAKELEDNRSQSLELAACGLQMLRPPGGISVSFQWWPTPGTSSCSASSRRVTRSTRTPSCTLVGSA